ncbi:hypothetical protein DM806_05590 [Sphingobium lactosutens]|nr:hypothetical protein [Sphingobium lactosutens]
MRRAILWAVANWRPFCPEMLKISVTLAPCPSRAWLERDAPALRAGNVWIISFTALFAFLITAFCEPSAVPVDFRML